MTDLTEQWKKGELPEGWYWVKKKTCEEYIDKVYFWYDTFIDGDVPLDNDKVIEVLARVPSYEEWKASEKYIKHLEEKIKIYERKDKQATETSIAYNELAEENEELKEILERHKKATAKAEIRSCDLEIINAQLKEMLKECKQWFDWYHIDTGTGKEYIESWHKKGYEIHKQLDEALQ